ncbi:hypothetical protein [Longimicrobium sp.]|uniref:hypothetical protein n=1 Tax=Longimicrobium sp. TaxID=2029185 RepID=UPI002F9460C8
MWELAGNAYYAVSWAQPSALLDGLIRMVLATVIVVALLRGWKWGYPAALVFSAAIAAVMLTVYASVWVLDGDPPWRGDTPMAFTYQISGPLIAGAAFILLLHRRRISGVYPDARLRSLARRTGVAFAVEVVLMTSIAIWGFGGWQAEWYRDVLAATQAPGIALLTDMGLCCGYFNSLVISDVWGPHWNGLTRVGIPILVVANTVGLLVLARLIQAGARLASRSLKPASQKVAAARLH